MIKLLILDSLNMLWHYYRKKNRKFKLVAVIGLFGLPQISWAQSFEQSYKQFHQM